MARRTNEWKLGLFVVASAAVAIGALIWLGANRLQRETLEVVTFFDEPVDGLDPGSPVKYLGVTIGQVKTISLAEDTRHVKVTTEIFVDELVRLDLPTDLPTQEEQVDSGLRVQLVTSALTGVSYLEGSFFDVEDNPPPEYPFPIPSNTVHTVPSTLKSLETGLVDAMKSIPEVVEHTSHILERFESAMDDIQFRKLSNQAIEMMASLQERLDKLDEMPVLVEGEAAMSEARLALSEIRVVVQDLAGENGRIVALLERYDEVGSDLQLAIRDANLPRASESLQTMSGDVGSAANELGLLSVELRSDLVYMRRALRSLSSLSSSLERDPGALLHGRTVQTRPK